MKLLTKPRSRESGLCSNDSVVDNYRSVPFKELAKEIITQKKASFATISKLLKWILVLPMSSVPCERRVLCSQQDKS